MYRSRHSVRVLFLAIVVGSIAVAPSLLAPLALGQDYRGVQVQLIDNDDTYRVQIKELFTRHSVVSPYLLEYKEEMNAPVPAINLWFYALPAAFLGVPAILLLSKFLFPALLFFLVYLGTRSCVRSIEERDRELLAIAAGLAVTLGFDLVDVRHVFAILQGTAFPSPLVWTRLVNPIVGALEVFGVVALLAVIVERRARFAYVALGALLALTVGYFFSFGIALAMTGTLLLIMIVRKEYVVARELLFAILISFVLTVGYWYQILTTVGGETGRMVAQHNGMFYTHTPVVNLFLLATSIVVLSAYGFSRWVKREQIHTHVWSYLGAFLGGSWIAFNQQVLTGREIWYPHFVQYVIPLCFVSLLVAGYLTVHSFAPKLTRRVLFFVCSGALAYGIFSVTSYVPRIDEFRELQDTAAVFSILGQKPDTCVAFVLPLDSTLERLIPAYTPCSVYSTSFVFYGVPKERILHNYLTYLRLQGVTEKGLHAYLLAHQTEVRQYFFDDWHQLFSSDVDPWLLERFSMLEGAYSEFSKKDLLGELQKYRIDYVITPNPLSPSVLNELPGLALATSTTRYFLYSF